MVLTPAFWFWLLRLWQVDQVWRSRKQRGGVWGEGSRGHTAAFRDTWGGEVIHSLHAVGKKDKKGSSSRAVTPL